MFQRPSYWIAALVGVAVMAACARPPGQWEFDRGMRELKRGRYVQAQTLFEQSIARRPGHAANATAYNLIGLACWEMGKRPEAQDAFERCLQLDPSHPDALFNLGVLAAAQRDTEQAARLLKRAHEALPSKPDAMLHLARIAMNQTNWTDARSYLDSARSASPATPALYTGLALIEWEQGRATECREALQEALALQPAYAPALFNLASVSISTRAYDDAIEYLDRFLDVADTNSAYARSAETALRQLRGMAPATVQQPPNTSAPGVATGRTTVAAPPTVADPVAQARALLEKGKATAAAELLMQSADRVRTTQPAEQERLLREAIRIAPKQASAHEALGLALLDARRPSDALGAYKLAVTLNPASTEAHLGMVKSAVQSGEPDAALASLRDALRKQPDQRELVWALAELYDRNLDLPPSAAKAYRDFAAKFPTDSRAGRARTRAAELEPADQMPPHNAVIASRTIYDAPDTARLRVDQLPPAAQKVSYRPVTPRDPKASGLALQSGAAVTDLARRRDLYLRAIEFDDTSASAFYSLASTYTALNEIELAKSAYLRCLRLDGRHVSARYNLALLYQQEGRPAAAILLLEDLVRDQPEHARARYALAYLLAQDPARRAEARTHYDVFLRILPTDPAAPAVRQWIQRNT